MKLRELRLFARISGSRVSPSAAQALGLPMPYDVLEQFIVDHALKPEFQQHYGELDLYRIAWSREDLQIDYIGNATSKYPRHIEETRHTYASISSLEEAPLLPEAKASWTQHGTWVRPPVFLRQVLPTPDEWHLVEGHSRVGALLGSRENPRLALARRHECWVGRPTQEYACRDWKAVRRRHPVTFGDWLYDAIGQDDHKGKVATAVIEAEARHRYELSLGKDFSDFRRLSEFAPSEVDADALEKLHHQWRLELEL